MTPCRKPLPSGSWLGDIRDWFLALYEAVLAPLAVPAYVVLMLFLFFCSGGGGSPRLEALRLKAEQEQRQREDLDRRIRAAARSEQDEAARRESQSPAWQPFGPSRGDPFAPVRRR
jgi:hypothetical protein